MNRKPNKTTWQKGHVPHNKGKRDVNLDEETLKAFIDDYKSGIVVDNLAIKYNMTTWAARAILIDNDIPRVSSGFRRRGTERPAETKAKISAARMGHEVSQYVRDQVSKANKLRTKEQRQIQVTKGFLTKKKNGTLNTSASEEQLYEYLLKENVNKTIYRQYKDPERYPFYCDFYIVEDDLFIELNAHWTHGGRPYDPDDPECQATLVKWQEKAKQSKFYAQAIYIWTDLDPRKKKCAEDHNLNFKAIY